VLALTDKDEIWSDKSRFQLTSKFILPILLRVKMVKFLIWKSHLAQNTSYWSVHIKYASNPFKGVLWGKTSSKLAGQIRKLTNTTSWTGHILKGLIDQQKPYETQNFFHHEIPANKNYYLRTQNTGTFLSTFSTFLQVAWTELI